jgi:ABC-type uncharacterized transport system permease subunit
MILLYLLVFAAYMAAAWVDWHALTHAPPALAERRRALLRMLLPLAIAAHAVLIASNVFAHDGLDLSLVNALSAVAGLAALFAWMGSLARLLPGVAVIVLPVAAFAVVLPALFPSTHRMSFVDEPLAALHIAVALIGYALLIVAALQALVLMGLERRLHQGLPDPKAEQLPPLLTLERFLFRLVAVGYVLLTLTLGSGMIFSEQVFGKPLTFTHKIVFSVLGWIVFTGLLYGRYRHGWRGRSAFKWILAGTALLFLAYIGSKFVLEVILRR